MTLNFPDPDDEINYTYVTENGVTINYSWDGEKWLASGVTGGITDVDTRQVALVNAINAFADVLPPMEELKTQEDYNKYIYDGIKYLFDNGAAGDVDGGIYNPITVGL